MAGAATSTGAASVTAMASSSMMGWALQRPWAAEALLLQTATQRRKEWARPPIKQSSVCAS
jgi:hypothetical protein